MSSWIDLVPGSLNSPPSWRWGLAQWMVRTGRAVPDHCRDDSVDRAHRYLTGRSGSRRDPAVQQAAELHLDAPRLRRAQLEAYLLTGEPLAVVAGRCAVPVPTAKAYHKLFFDIRLTARDKVALIIGPGLAAGLGDQEPWRRWLAFGYYAGLVALDAVIVVTVEDGLVEGAADLPRTAPHVADERLRKSVRLALDAMMLPADTPLAVLAELHAQARRIASRPRRRPVPDTVTVATGPLPELPDITVLLPPEDAAAGSVA
jgi:hypothetical protein